MAETSVPAGPIKMRRSAPQLGMPSHAAEDGARAAVKGTGKGSSIKVHIGAVQRKHCKEQPAAPTPESGVGAEWRGQAPQAPQHTVDSNNTRWIPLLGCCKRPLWRVIQRVRMWRTGFCAGLPRISWLIVLLAPSLGRANCGTGRRAGSG